MAWTIITAMSLGTLASSPRRSQSTWAPEPQKPSTPWVPETITSTFSASRGPNQATSVERSPPSGPRFGLAIRSRAPPAAAASSTNFARASA